MGVLETRVLDFGRLIVLSVNEGFFPARKAAASFIPYNLRRGFGLPTYEHQDSIWAYHFYRMIARAKHVTLLYDTRTDGLNTGEVSRYVHQLRYHYPQGPRPCKWSKPKRPSATSTTFCKAARGRSRPAPSTCT